VIWRDCAIRAGRRTAVCCVLAAAVLLAPPQWVEAAHWWVRVAWAALRASRSVERAALVLWA